MTYYKTLNVSETASQDEIKSSFRKLAMKYHPDKNPGDKSAEENFKKINEAYMTLSDPIKRKDYDNSRRFNNSNNSSSSYSWRNQRNNSQAKYNPFDNPFGEEDIFEEMFKQYHRQSNQSSSSNTRKSSAIPTVSLSLKFWEAAFGGTKKIKIPAKVLPGGVFANIAIEPGIEDGTRLQVTIKNKIFYINITVKEDKLFKREGLHLYTNFDVPLTTSILGGSVIFPHWNKELEITIPPETSQGKTFRLKQMGLSKNGVTGDLYIAVNIVPPQRLTKKQKELMEEFQKLEKQKESTSYKNLKKLWESCRD